MSPSKQSVSIERDCVHLCKSKVHGDLLSAVLTKRALTPVEMCAYLNWVCGDCAFAFDSVYRTLLHVAASRGLREVAEWLVHRKHAPVDVKDRESGYTAFHRSIFYGQISVAVFLMKFGVNTNILDHDGLTGLDHAMKDRLGHISYSFAHDCEVYMWGSNSNYTLGVQQTRPYPEVLSKQNLDVPIKQVCLRKFHCVMVSKNGRVFACGHGQGGRLGTGQTSTALRPTLVSFNARPSQATICKQAAIGRDHSMFLMDNSIIWTCGLNSHHVLGIHPPPELLLSPKALPEFKTPIQGICAARFHSVAWGSTAVYTWGLNAGQLGHNSTISKTIITPKLVTSFRGPNFIIEDVAASDGATVVLIQRGDIYVLHEYQCRKIASRQLNVAKVAVIGGHLNTKLDKSLLGEREPLKVLVLTKSGNVLLSQEPTLQLTRCIFSLNRPLIIKDAVLNKSNILLVTIDGEAFQGHVRDRKKAPAERVTASKPLVKKSPFHEFLDKHECEMITVSRLSNVHRAVSIHSDSKGRNFAVLQNDPRVHMAKIPSTIPTCIQTHMLTLLKDADETDGLHDVLFKVGCRIYPAHRFIVANASSVLEDKIQSCTSDYLDIPGVQTEIFEQILEFIYTKTCSLLSSAIMVRAEDLKRNDKSDDEQDHETPFEIGKNNKRKIISNDENKVDPKNPVRMLQAAAKQLGVTEMYVTLDAVNYLNGKVHFKKELSTKEVKFDRQSFPHLYDVEIKCNNNAVLQAHKCILAGRLDYFNNTFAERWNKNGQRTTVTLPFSVKIVEIVIDFLYTDFAHTLEIGRDIDSLCSILTVADQLFITRLKEICETALVNELTLRNVSQFFQFADVYNACILKQCCMDFICVNLPSILECRSLETVEDALLTDLDAFYWRSNEKLHTRMITPYSVAPSDEIVKSICDIYPINLEYEDLDSDRKNVKSSSKKKSRTRKASGSENQKSHSFSEGDSGVSTNTVDGGETRGSSKRSDSISPDSDKVSTEWSLKLNSQQKLVQARLRAMAGMKQQISESSINIPDTFTKLNGMQHLSQSPPANVDLNSPIGSPRSTLCSELNFETVFEYAKSLPKHENGKQRMPKISQKQRKKMAAENSMSVLENHLDRLNLKEVTKEEAESMPEPILSPKNPWRRLDILDPQQELKTQFPDIIADEQKKKENFTKMRAKSFLLTQIEDRAIEELKRFYNVENNFDEYLTVKRVTETQIAAPVWVNATGKNI